MSFIQKLTLVVIVFVLSGVSFADTVYVNGAGTLCDGNSAYATIQEAIDVADDGDTVLVCPDAEYNENVIVNKSVGLLGNGPGVVIRAAIASNPVVTITEDDVSVSGFELRDATGSYGLFSTASHGTISHITSTNNDIGFYLSGSSYNELTSNIAHDNADEGFRISLESNNNTLVDNVAYNQMYYGFYIYESSGNSLISNTAFNSSSWYGFFLYSGARDNFLSDNTAHHNGHYGFHLYLNSHNVLTDNTAYNNSADGFRLSTSSGNTIFDNTAHGNLENGFHISSSSSNAISDNTAHGNLENGFLLSSSMDNNLENNDAYNNSRYGFYTHLSSGNDLLSNRANRNEDGFRIYSGSDNQLANNTAYDNDFGFYLYTATDNHLSHNTARNNRQHGFLFSSCSRNNITDNDAYDNLNYGFYSYLGSANSMENNVAHENLYGIVVSSGSDSSLSGNSAYENTITGIYLYLSSGNDLLNNSAYSNLHHGFYLHESPANTLMDNIAINNGQNGIYVYQSPNNNLEGNTASGNANGFAFYSSTRNTLTRNTASHNLQDGFYLYLSTRPTLSSNTAHSNGRTGTYVSSSRNSNLENEYYYNNGVDFTVSAASTMQLTLNGVIFGNPSGLLGNYTNISIDDRLKPNTTYSLTWTSQPASLPHPYISFENKYLDITGSPATVSIDTIVWHWLDSELGSHYKESGFSVWQHDSEGWLDMVPVVDTWENTLTISGLIPASIYGILMNRSLPGIALNYPEPGGVVNATEFNVSWTVYSYDETVLCDIVMDDSRINGFGINTTSGAPASYPVSFSEQRSYSWNVTCQDSVGPNTSETRDFHLDLPPSVWLDSAEAVFISGSEYELVYTAVDGVSSLLSCSLYLDGILNQTDGAVLNAVPSTFLMTDLGEGHHTAHVLCEDEVGNTDMSETKEITSDSTAPAIDLISPEDDYLGNDDTILFNFTADDALSPALNFTLFIDALPSESGSDLYFSVPVSEGSHNWSVEATDQAGNSNQSEARDFTIDRTPPVVHIDSPSDGLHIITSHPAEVEIIFNATDESSGTLDCSLFFDDALNQTSNVSSGIQSSYSLTDLDEGIHSAYVLCMDDAGNSDVSETRSILVDTVPPSLSLISPADGYLGSDTEITFNFDASDDLSPTVTSSLYIDGILQQSTSSDHFTVALSEGTHTWSITAVDDAGNSNSSEERSLTLDQSPPEITIHSPELYERIDSSSAQIIAFSFTAADNYAHKLDCDFYLGGSVSYSNHSVQDGVPVSFDQTVPPGSNEWWIECTDDAGNTGTSPDGSIIIRESIDDDGGSDSPDPRITISMEQNCPEDSITFTVSSGSGTLLRLFYEDLFLVSDNTDSDGMATFELSEAGLYEIRATKSSFRSGRESFTYSMCDTGSPDGGSDSGGGSSDSGGGDDGPEGEPDSGGPGDGQPGADGQSDDEDDEPLEETDGTSPGAEVDINVNDTVYKGDVVSVRVFVNNEAESVQLQLTSPRNDVENIMTDASGLTRFIAEEIGRYSVEVIDPDLPRTSASILVVEKKFISDSALQDEFDWFWCCPLFLLLLLILLASLAAMKREKKPKRKYPGYSRKKAGLFEKAKRTMGATRPGRGHLSGFTVSSLRFLQKAYLKLASRLWPLDSLNGTLQTSQRLRGFRNLFLKRPNKFLGLYR